MLVRGCGWAQILCGALLLSPSPLAQDDHLKTDWYVPCFRPCLRGSILNEALRKVSDSREEIGTYAIGVPHPFVLFFLLHVCCVEPVGMNSSNSVFHTVLSNPGDDGPVEWIRCMKGDDIAQNATTDIGPDWSAIFPDT